MPRTKEEMQKHTISSMLSDMKLIGLDLAKQKSRKTLGCAPSMREVCTKCERSGRYISESKIGDIEKNEWVNGS